MRELIDFTQPVALLLVAILHFIKDEEDPAGIVATLRDALPAGSYLALSHGTLDFHPPGDADQAAAGYQNATAPLVLRGHEQVSAFFEGFDLVEPGLVQAPLWRPEGKRPRPRDLAKIGIYAGVGRKGETVRPATTRTGLIGATAAESAELPSQQGQCAARIGQPGQPVRECSLGSDGRAAELLDPVTQVAGLRRTSEDRRGEFVADLGQPGGESVIRCSGGRAKAGRSAASAASSAPERRRTTARSMPARACRRTSAALPAPGLRRTG